MNTAKIIPMFVFGTLMNKETLLYLGVSPIQKEDAVLEGYRKDGLNIVPTENSVVNGHYFQVDQSELQKLDRYERLDSEWGYHRFLVNVRIGNVWKRAYVYQVKGT